MSLFTGRGDNGTTTTFHCDQRFTKGSDVAEALGTVDELNSLLGIVKVKSGDMKIFERNFSDYIEEVQQNLFIVQAELAGADKHLVKEKIDTMSDLINRIEKEMPPIKSFFVSGGTEIAATFDFARTVARRAERRVVTVMDNKTAPVSPETLAYLNRLSSMMYAFARLSNHLFGIKEESPNYR